MRELILAKIEAAIAEGDEEIEENFCPFNEIQALSDPELLEVVECLYSFRG